MGFTYVLTEPTGQVRLLIPDTVTPGIFSDEEIAALLLLEGSRVKRAAALALETIASSEAYTQKVIKLLDLSTDGAKVSDALLARALALRAQDAADLVNEDAADGAGFEVAEWDLGPASQRDYLSRNARLWGY